MNFELPVKYSETPPSVRRRIREQYVSQQGGLCWFCGDPLAELPKAKKTQKSINRRLFPPNFFEWPIHLQHDHKTDLTEGAVHAKCNAILWQYHGR